MEQIVEQRPSHETAVRDFNRRLRQGGSDFEFPPDLKFPIGSPEGVVEPTPLHEVRLRKYVLVDGDTVRGGYILIRHGAASNREVIEVEFLKLPLSEAVIDRQYAAFGALLMSHAVRQSALMYGLGGGGAQSAVMQMLKRCRFRLTPVPFRFRVLNPIRFLQNIQVLRSTRARRAVLDFTSRIPLVPRLLDVYQWVHTDGALLRGVDTDIAPRFGSWADELWELCASTYSLISVRDSATLNWRLPPEDERIRRIKVFRGNTLLGWVAVTLSKFTAHKQFGALRVGAIIDALGLPGEESTLCAAALRELRESGADLVVSNQSAKTWIEALDRNGFMPGTSNFIFAASPQLASLIDSNDPCWERVHLNRCDGDGPIHL